MDGTPERQTVTPEQIGLELTEEAYKGLEKFYNQIAVGHSMIMNNGLTATRKEDGIYIVHSMDKQNPPAGSEKVEFEAKIGEYRIIVTLYKQSDARVEDMYPTLKRDFENFAYWSNRNLRGEGGSAKPYEKDQLMKDLFFVTVSVVAGLSLLGLVSDTRQTAQIVYATKPSQVSIFVMLAVIFLLSAYIFLSKPLHKYWSKLRGRMGLSVKGGNRNAGKDAKFLKQFLLIFTSTTTGLALMDLLSSPERTSNVIAITNPVESITYMAIGVAFIVSLLMILKVPFPKILKRR